MRKSIICIGATLSAIFVATAPCAIAAATPKSVMVTMETTTGQDGGAIVLVGEGNSIKFTVQLQNLDPGMHGIHIHQSPSCDAPSFASAGGHFNPGGKEHGYDNPKGHHAGDIDVNLKVGDNGKVRQTFTVHGLTLNPNAPDSVFANGGTSIIIHNGPDDQKTNPSGNSGGREACGIISIDHASNKILVLRQQTDGISASND